MVQTRLKVGNYEAWVVVEKEEVEHYSIEVDEEENLATCWIASTAGKVSLSYFSITFLVNWNFGLALWCLCGKAPC